MIGTRLGPYEIIEELGKGGMATVYRAYHPPMERHVAVKVIRRQLVEELAARERFQREARIIARLEHPHLLPVYDFDGGHDPPYIVMRQLEGGTLKEALVGRRLPLVEVSHLLLQIGAALDYAHRQGVVHRDIKPSNIMIDQEGNAFVMDFGIARMTRRDVTDGGLTAAGTIIGTPDYMAPEQSYGQGGITLRADIYALGVMVFEMLTGQLPFQGKTSMETILQHLTHPVPRATELNPDLDPRIDQLIITAMAKEATQRYATVSEFVEAVTAVLGGGVAVTPKALQAAAQESLSILVDRRAENQERLDATLAEFAAARGERVPKSDSQATPTQQHRTVTALFVDAAEYGELLDLEEGPETAKQAVHELWATTTLAVEEEGGAVFGRSERDLLAVWGAVSAREDDPERAVRAALSVRQALGQRVGHLLGEDEPLPIRLGLNTGPALIALDDETDSYSASGATISLASRVARNADGLILATHDTFRHIQGVFTMEEDLPIRVRRAGGRAEVSTYRILDVKPRAFRLQPRGVEGVETRMIGRRAELEQLQKAFFNAIEDSETQLVTVVGAAGLGKSRLLYEFAAWAELRPHPYFIFRGRARPGMSQRPYSLWRDILSFRFEILDSDSPEMVRQKLTDGIAELIGPSERLAHLMGYLAGFDLADSPYLNGEPQDVAEQSRRAVAEFLHRLTAIDPVMIQLEDLHHADEASLDLLAEVSGNDPGLPLLLVGLTRPALYERRPTWGSGQDFHLRIELRPLDKRDSRDLVAEVLQRVDEIPRQLRDLLVERAEGNPYYMEELVKMLVEDRVIKKLSESRWAVEVSRLQGLRVPPTLVGLLQTRFDSLLYPEKLTLQRAAVVGRVFYDRALLMLDAADETHVDDLATVLQNLTEREFIFPRELSAFEGSAEYIFAQAMMRDLVLETLLERQAAAYHRAAAQWLAAQGGARVGEYDALIAQHYEQAGDRVPAAEHYYRAAKAAFAVSAVQEGIRASEKALALLGEADEPLAHVDLRLDIQLDLANVLGFLGDHDRTKPLLESALATARGASNRTAEANALAQLGRFVGLWRNQPAIGQAFLEEALQIYREVDDQSGLAFVVRQLGNMAFSAGSYDEAGRYFEESLALGRALENDELIANAYNGLGLVAQATNKLEEALNYYQQGTEYARRSGDKLQQTMLRLNMGLIHAEQGDLAITKRIAREGLAVAQEANSVYLLPGAWIGLGWAALEANEFETARQNLEMVLSHFGETRMDLHVYLALALYAELEAQLGETESSLHLLGFLQTAPDPLGAVRRLIERTLAKLATTLPPEQIEAALLEGSGLTLQDILGQFSESKGAQTAH